MSAPIAQGISHMFNQVRDGLLPLFILLLYTVFGALLFRELEGPNEKYMLETLRKERDVLLENTVFRLNNIRAMQPVAAYNHTVKTLLKYQDRLGVEQNYFSTLLHCIIVVSAIQLSTTTVIPVTTAGRVLTILYAFAGIPLAVICLFSLGAIFARLCKILWKYMLKSTAVVSKDLEKRQVNAAVGFDEARQIETSKLVEQSADDDDDLLSFPISFLVFLTILWVFICAGIFLLFEDWDYGTSLYFTLISFTTIGFGDILPSEYDYIVVVGVLLLIGLSLVSTVLTLIQQQIEALATVGGTDS
uniref:Ion_trans_2 domain-containing protein n=1 Tax=Heterorhabditis bacteriophora TaxID=37862 RepID=A0A1I7WQ55_HETBA